MKAAKYLAFALGIVAVLVAVGWYLRNTLIERLSNPVLAEYNVEIVDVSLDALATNNATIGYLELVHDKGTTIAVEGLSLPIGTTDGLKKYSARKVSVVTATREDEAPFELAILIDQLLSLPDDLAGSEINIEEFSLAPYPIVRDLRWALTDNAQDLRARVRHVSLSVSATRTGSDSHTVEFSLPAESSTRGPSISAELVQSRQGISITASSTLDIPTWQPLGRLAGVLPDNIDISSGTAMLKFDAEIPYDTNRLPSVTAEIAPSIEIELTHTDVAGDITTILAKSGSTVTFSATFPKIDWNLNQDEALLIVTRDEWTDIPIVARAVACRSADPGPVCSMKTDVSVEARKLPIGDVGLLRFSSMQDIAFVDDELRIKVQPDASLLLRELSVSDDVAVTVALVLEKLVISESDGVISADASIFAAESYSLYKDLTMSLPGFKGQVSVNGPGIAAKLTTVGLFQDGNMILRHDLSAGTGRLSVETTELSFTDVTLSDRVSPWRWNTNLNAGAVAFDLAFNWSKDFSEIDMQASTVMNGLAGYYEDIAFADVSTALDIAYNTATEFTVEPSTLNVSLIDMGFPIEDLTAIYLLDASDLAVEVDALSMSAFGGRITADPFRYSSRSDGNNLVLRAELVDLSKLLSIEEFDDIEVSGSIAAKLPVRISGDAIQIVDGSLTGEAPGGVIQYRPEGAVDSSDTSSIGLVRQALSNFQYEALTSEVSYTEDGDLKLKMRLTGRNPDLDESRPVVLNLNVENNVPKMLKSLQAARAVEDILEQRLQE